jgi:hypothetical protein
LQESSEHSGRMTKNLTTSGAELEEVGSYTVAICWGQIALWGILRHEYLRI